MALWRDIEGFWRVSLLFSSVPVPRPGVIILPLSALMSAAVKDTQNHLKRAAENSWKISLGACLNGTHALLPAVESEALSGSLPSARRSQT